MNCERLVYETKKILIQHFVETAASQTAAIKIMCVMFDLQDEPDAFTVYQGEVQEIPQTFLSRKVNCWEVKGKYFTLICVRHGIDRKRAQQTASCGLNDRRKHICLRP